MNIQLLVHPDWFNRLSFGSNGYMQIEKFYFKLEINGGNIVYSNNILKYKDEMVKTFFIRKCVIYYSKLMWEILSTLTTIICY